MPRLMIFAFIGLTACGGSSVATSEYTIKFNPLVSGMPFSCTASYPNIGTTKTTIEPLDFRMYVHDVALVRAGGATEPLTLKADGKWQAMNIALLDFEDGTGTCMTGTTETNFNVVGSAPTQSDYTGVQFTLGVPMDMDHLDSATAAAPLNTPAMWWSWVGGYRYLRIDVQSLQNESWNFHLGAMDCVMTSPTDITCKYENQAVVALTTFSGTSATISMDLATLYADSDLDHQVDGVTDQVPGCMSGPGDPECPPLFNKVGLSFESTATPPAQTFFVGQ